MSTSRPQHSSQPSDGTGSWATKIRSLQSEIDRESDEESRRLEQELAVTRFKTAERQSRRQPEDNETNDPNGNRESTRRAPIPLAHFIGGSTAVTGPRLNKPKPQDNPQSHIDHDATPYKHGVSPLARVAAGPGGPADPARGVRMHGLGADKIRTNVRSSTTPVPSDGRVGELASRFGSSVPPLARPATFTGNTSTVKSNPIPSFPSRANESTLPEVSPKPSPSPSPKPISALKSPFLSQEAASTSAPAFSRAQSQKMAPKALTPSLTRLQGRGFVGERVKAAAEVPTSPISPQSPNPITGPPSGRPRSVLDRWPAASTSTPESTNYRFQQSRGAPGLPADTVTPKIQPSIISATNQPTPSVSFPSSISRAGSSSSVKSTPLSSSPVLADDREAPHSNVIPWAKSQSSGPVKVHVPPKPNLHQLPGLAQSKSPASLKTQSQSLNDQDVEPSVISLSKAVPQRLPGLGTNAPRLDLPTALAPEANDDLLTSQRVESNMIGDVKKTTPPTAPTNSIGSARSPPSSSSQAGPVLLHPTRNRARRSRPMQKVGKPPSNEAHTLSPALPQAGTHNSEASVELSSGYAKLPSTSDAIIKSSPPLLPSKPVFESVASGSRIKNLTATWNAQPPISAKSIPPLEASKTMDPSPPQNTASSSSVGRRALPFMAAPTLQHLPDTHQSNQESLHQPEISPESTERPTVMELVRAMSKSPAADVLDQKAEVTHDTTTQPSPPIAAPDVPSSAPSSIPTTESRGHVARPSVERRQSSYKKYADIAMPPLVEEQTPPPSLSKAASRNLQTVLVKSEESSAVPVPSAGPKTSHPVDKPLPVLDVPSIVATANNPRPLSFDPTAIPISTDVLSIVGRNASAISSLPHIFYESELRAILYRSKDTKTMLASTTLWVWRGKAAVVKEDEEWKVNDLERRFGTKAIRCAQGSEPFDLIGLLGGVIAVRHGSRVNWSTDNMTLHCVRCGPAESTVVIDEVDLDIHNLCSAYSYVATVLGVIYVWHGRGSLAREASQATAYASLLSTQSGDTMSIMEFKEGEEDPMFFMVLGSEPFASAEFWSERPALEDKYQTPLVWKVELEAEHPNMVQHVDALPDAPILKDGVYVLGGLFEIFVIIGAGARGNRDDIRLALSLAEGLSNLFSHNRPFTPPVHVLMLPSRLPLDLRVGHLRFIDEDALSEGTNHINLLSLAEAREHLSTFNWPPRMLRDASFLPLGVHPQ